MIHRQADSELHDYIVHVGHHELHVRGRDADQAVRAARRQLCDELPRMWDLIQRLQDDRFTVQEVRTK